MKILIELISLFGKSYNQGDSTNTENYDHKYKTKEKHSSSTRNGVNRHSQNVLHPEWETYADFCVRKGTAKLIQKIKGLVKREN